MITNGQIRQTILNCKKEGHVVGLRDIAYVLLCKHIEEPAMAYRILFGLDKDFSPEYGNTYDQTSAISYLKSYIDINLDEGVHKKREMSDDISFEENKAEMIKLIEEAKQAREDGTMKTSDSLKIQSDLRVKLNDKFNVADETQEQMIIVNTKYNDICPRCGVEISRRPITKLEAMEMYDLVEKEDTI